MEGVTLEDSSVGVTVDLEKMISKKTVTLHPVANGELPPDLKLDGIKIEASAPKGIYISSGKKRIEE